MQQKKLKYHYMFLHASEQKMYEHIYDQLAALQPTVKVSGTLEMAKKVTLAVLDDCPEFFYVDNTHVSFLAGGGLVEIKPDYIKSPAEIHIIRQRLNAIKERFLQVLEKKKMGDRAAVAYVHNLILRVIDYAEENRVRGDVSGDVSTICGVFINYRAVCKGISLAAKWLLDQAGIPSGVVEGRVLTEHELHLPQNMIDGTLPNNHAWNIVKVNGCWQYMDVTMDLGACQEDRQWIAYDYFLRNDENMRHYVFYQNPLGCPVEPDSYFNRKKVCFSEERTLRRFFRYCAEHQVKRICFQVKGKLEKRSGEELIELLERYIFTGFRWKENKKLKIYDVLVT